MTARWAIVKATPKTARCKTCRRTSNRLSVFREGCYSCLVRPTVAVAAAAITDAAPIPVSTSGCGPTCARLPRHKGACRPTLRRRVA